MCQLSSAFEMRCDFGFFLAYIWKNSTLILSNNKKLTNLPVAKARPKLEFCIHSIFLPFEKITNF